MRKAITFLSAAIAATSSLALAVAQYKAPWHPHTSQRPTARAIRAAPAAYQRADAAPLPPVNARANAPAAPEPVPLGPQAPLQSLTLDDLQSMALANNPTLAQAAARVQAARGRWVQAGLHPNPKIGYMADDIGAMDTAGKQGGCLLARDRP